MKIFRPSDTDISSPNYSSAVGYYTDVTRITDLLGIPLFTSSTYPSLSHVGELIRRAEDYIDEFTRESWRPTIIENEYHDFDFDLFRMYSLNANWRYRDYVGFIRLNHEHVRKILRLSVWRGSLWEELAGSKATITITDYTSITGLQLTAGGYTWTLNEDANNDGTTYEFSSNFGDRTTAQDMVYLINEEMPVNTQGITGSTGAKALLNNSNTGTKNISDYFYATLEEDGVITISSLLLGDDGDACTISITTGATVVDFADNENRGRQNDWWSIDHEGSIFFRANYPYQAKHSVRITYIAGKHRVPAIITEAATKLVVCELLMEDDNTLMLGENNESGIDLKSKYDAYLDHVHKILNMKKSLVYFIDSD